MKGCVLGVFTYLGMWFFSVWLLMLTLGAAYSEGVPVPPLGFMATAWTAVLLRALGSVFNGDLGKAVGVLLNR